MTTKSLRQRWHVATKFLTGHLYTELGFLHPDKFSSKLKSDEILSVLNEWFSKVEQHYNEPHRAYHNLTHIQDVFVSLDLLLVDDDIADTTIATLATFFHDVIYNPQSSTNEQDSADLFVNFVSDLMNAMQRMGNASIPLAHIDIITESNLVSQIKQCIIATATHIESAHQARMSQNGTLLSAFLDADMSILGKDTNTYDKYASSIRREYEFVERSVYCEKRAEILTSFLPSTTSPIDETKQHQYIYATEKGRELWEIQARENLKREINMLRQGLISPGE